MQKREELKSPSERKIHPKNLCRSDSILWGRDLKVNWTQSVSLKKAMLLREKRVKKKKGEFLLETKW